MLNEISQLITQYKDTIGLVLTGLAGSVTHIFNKVRKGEKLTFGQHISHLIISGFVGLMIGFICNYLGLEATATHIIVGISAYLGIQIIDAIDMIRAKTIYEILIDFLRYKIGKK